MSELDREPAARLSGLTRGLLSAVAVFAILVGVTAAATWLRADGSGDDDSIPDDTATADAPPDELATGWRYESFGDVQVQVPVTWGYDWAPGSDWCVTGGDEPSPFPTEPFVDIRGPFSGVLDILCGEGGPTPDLGDAGVPKRFWAPHLSFTFAERTDGPADGTTSDGGWTRIVRTVGATRISVLTDDTHLADARRIVASATTVETDAHGCAATSAIQAAGFQRPEPAFDIRRIESVDSIAVCQYLTGAGTDQPGKIGSRGISGDAAQNLLLAAIKAAPVGGGPEKPDACLHDNTDGTAIVLRLREGDRVHDMHVYYESCVNNGFDDGTTRRALTLASCEPLWGGRVVRTSGIHAAVRACDSSVDDTKR